jgi:hypothetical protein
MSSPIGNNMMVNPALLPQLSNLTDGLELTENQTSEQMISSASNIAGSIIGENIINAAVEFSKLGVSPVLSSFFGASKNI